MSKIVDLDQNAPEISDEEVLVDVNEAQEFEEREEAVEEPPKPKIPKKFEGKAPEEIAAAYAELEKELGRKGNEIGELRKLTDQLLELEIQQKKNQQQQTKVKEDDLSVDDWFEAPDKATEKYLEKSSLKRELDEIKENLASQNREKAHAAFIERHPDYTEVASDPAFAEWVQKSKYRASLVQAADKYDYEAADELFSLYKEVASVKAQEKKAETKERVEKDRKKASLETSSKAGGTKKVYRRADLIRLKMTDPDRYMQMQDEIMQAYVDGRVR